MTKHCRIFAALPLITFAVCAHAQEPASEAGLVPVPPPPLILDLPDYPAYVPFVAAGPPRLPQPVRAMLEAGMKTDDSAAVSALVKFAIQTNPYDKDEIRDLHRAYNDRRARELAAMTAAKIARIRASGVLELWEGQVEMGAFRSTGNTSNFGVTGAAKLDRKGINWEHMLQARADYQEDRGQVTRSQYSASYQPRYTLDEGFFTYGRAQFERDKIQGFAARYSLAAGLGYRILDRPGMTLALEAGPAARHVNYVDGLDTTTWSTLSSVDFDWTLNPTIKLTQDASAYVGSDNSTFTSLTGLEAGMAKGLKVKLSYSIEHETSPPPGALKTDTISRFSLLYGF